MKSCFFSMAFLCLVIISNNTSAQCIQSGPFNVSVSANNTSTGSVPWSSPLDAILPDNNYAQAIQVLSLFATTNTNYVVVEGLGFSIPAGATICGITVAIERSAGGLSLGGSVLDASVRIVKNGSITGTNHASGASWGSTDAVATYGSSSDAWGTTWTAADINAAGFGVAIAATLQAGLVSVSLSARIDHISVTVHYMNPSILPLKPQQVTTQVPPSVRNIGFYPNPAGSTIYITGRRKAAAITIKDLEGRLVKRVNIDPAIRSPQVSLVDINPGLYLLEIDNMVFRLSVVK